MLQAMLLGSSLVISGAAMAVTSIVQARNSTTRAPLVQVITAVVVAALGGGAIAAGLLSSIT